MKNLISILKWNRKFWFTNYYVVFIMMIHQFNRGWQSNKKMNNVQWFYHPISTSSFFIIYSFKKVHMKIKMVGWLYKITADRHRLYKNQSCKLIFSQSMDFLVWRWIISMNIHDFFCIFFCFYQLLLLFARVHELWMN